MITLSSRRIVALPVLLSILLVSPSLHAQTDPSVPLGSAIAIPLPDERRKDLERYEIPELAGAEPAVGSLLIDGRLPKPVIDYVVEAGDVLQRLSLFEHGLAVVHIRGAGIRLFKKVILPPDAFETYTRFISPSVVAEISGSRGGTMTSGRTILRAYDKSGVATHREFDPAASLPGDAGRARTVLQDLLRAMAEDRDITNPLTGRTPRVGDRLIGEDQKIYTITREVAGGEVYELRGGRDPVTIYVARKDLHLHFVAIRSGRVER